MQTWPFYLWQNKNKLSSRNLNTVKKIITRYYKSPVGELVLGAFNEHLCLCDWRYRDKRKAIDSRLQTSLKSSYQGGSSNIIEMTIQQLNEYFDTKRTTFNVPLLLTGTHFQKQVWQALETIPFGQTASYSQLANMINNKNAVRAVANANAANAIAIIIPCHRVIGSNGSLTGYAGGLEAKNKLLELEKR